MRTRSVVAPLSLSLALLLQFSDAAQAGPVEQLAQVALHPTDSKVIVLRYRDGGDGFFYSRDSGETWELMCLSAIDIEVPRSGPIAVTGDGHVMMGVFQGLYTDDAKGCGWTKNEFVGSVWISDVVPHPSDPGVMFAAQSKGGMGVLNGIVKRDADGEFSDVGKKEELLVTQLRVVEREGKLRFYESVLKGTIKVTVNGMEVDGPNYLIRYSDDEGETFTEFPFGATDGNLRLAAVDPSNPDRVVAVLNREGKDDDVLVSEDAGETFQLYMTMSQFGAIQFLPSGKVFLGESGISTLPSSAKALWVADSLDEDPVKLAEYPAQCLAYQESTDTLFACQYRTFGKVDQESGEYTQLFAFNEVKEFVDCPDVAKDCQNQLCQDYCTIGHFASATVCGAYEGKGILCGPCAAMVDNGADIAACTMPAGAGGSGAAGSSAGAGGTTGGSAGTTGNSAGTTAPPKPDAGTPSGGKSGDSAGDDGEDDGGACNCASVGARGNGFATPVAAGLLMGLVLTLRRRKSRGR